MLPPNIKSDVLGSIFPCFKEIISGSMTRVSANWREKTKNYASILNLILCIFLSVPIFVKAQEKAKDSSLIAFHGSSTLTSEFYNGSSPDTTFRPRLQALAGRAIIRAEITFPYDMLLPFEVYASTQKSTFQQPFNQFGVNPQFGSWLKLHGGFFSVVQSEFTFGDVRLFGGGFELTPDNFHFSAAYGLGRFAREPLAEANYPGEYDRKFVLISIGYGKPAKNDIKINIAYSADDSSSVLGEDSLRLSPQENLITSLSFAVKPNSWISMDGEAAASLFSSDTRLPSIDSMLHLPSFFAFTPRLSTQVDGATRFSIKITPSKEWSVNADAKWIGPGFVSLGWQAMQNDVLDIMLAPSFRLANGLFIARISGGMRFNNLRNNRLATTQRTIGSASIGWQISPALGVDMQYSNYGMRSSHLNDTLRIQNIFQNFSISPHYSFNWLTGINSIAANYSLQDIDDKNVFSSSFTRSKAHAITAVHTVFLPSTLQFVTSALFNSFSAEGMTASVVSITETAGKSWLDEALNISVTAGINIITAQKSDRQVTTGVNASYSKPSIGTFSLNIALNSFVAAQIVQTPSFRELTANITHRITF